jgi:heme/copper-type cytochrome/quinol oxidase subunit 3
MLIFLCAEAMLFAGFIAAHLVLRLGAAAWPPPGQPRLPVAVTALNTLVLIASGVAMRRAVRSAPAAFLGLAGSLGSIFLAIQGWEWIRLVAFGLRASATIYGALFYTLVGAHAVHAAAGVAWIVGMAGRSVATGAPPGGAAIAALEMYWLFVVGVWPAIFVTLYLL